MRNTFPEPIAAPAPPATWAPKLNPIKWNDFNDAPVFSQRNSTNALQSDKEGRFRVYRTKTYCSCLFYNGRNEILRLDNVYVPDFRCGQWNIANNNQRVVESRSQLSPIDGDEIAILTPKERCCVWGIFVLLESGSNSWQCRRKKKRGYHFWWN